MATETPQFRIETVETVADSPGDALLDLLDPHTDDGHGVKLHFHQPDADEPPSVTFVPDVPED